MLILTLLILALTAGLTFYFFQQGRINKATQKQFRVTISELERENHDLEEKIRVAVGDNQVADQKLETETREHQQQLLQMERYRLLVEDTDEFLFETNYKGQFIYANPVMIKRLGYAEDELEALSYDQLVLPENQKSVFQFYNRQYHEKQADSYAEWQVINRFGEEVWIGLRVRMTFDSLGRISSVKGIARDLSIQRTNEKQSQEQIDQFEDIFKLLPNPVLVFKKTSKGLSDAFLTRTNQLALTLMNLDWYEVAGLRMEDISSRLVTAVESLLNSTENQPIHWSPKTEMDRKFEVQAIQSKYTVLVMLTDVTRIEKAHQLIENERNFFKMVVDEIPFDLAVFTAGERFQYINKSAVKNDELRHWMIGKTDTEYMKFRQKELFRAILRRLKFDEVRATQSSIRFNELFVDSHNQVVFFARNLKPIFNKDTEIEYFIAAGFNYSDLYFQAEPDRIVADRWLFQSLLTETSITSSENPVSADLGLLENHPDGRHFQLHPETLTNLAFQIKQLSPSLSSLDLTLSFGNNGSDIFMIPRILIEETLKMLNQLSSDQKSSANLVAVHHPNGKTSIRLETEMLNIQTNQPERKKLCKIWGDDGFEATEKDGKLILEMTLNDLHHPINDENLSKIQVLKNHRILVGPTGNPKIGAYTTQLKESGAQVSLLPDFQLIGSALSKDEFDLVVWWGKVIPDFKDSDLATLNDQKIKILFYDDETEAKINSQSDELISTHPEPQLLEKIIEHVWLLAKEGSQMVIRNENLATNFLLKFNKLAEITEGDSVFTASLIRSYIISLQECETVFAKHIEVQDVEGLKFLLHKIRATIKTFEIKALENVIQEAIEAMVGNKTLSVKRKKDLASRLRQICGETKRQIREYALEQNLKV